MSHQAEEDVRTKKPERWIVVGVGMPNRLVFRVQRQWRGRDRNTSRAASTPQPIRYEFMIRKEYHNGKRAESKATVVDRVTANSRFTSVGRSAWKFLDALTAGFSLGPSSSAESANCDQTNHVRRTSFSSTLRYCTYAVVVDGYTGLPSRRQEVR